MLRRIQVGEATHIGMVRDNNQDAIATFLLAEASFDNSFFGFFIVADGMGGSEDGKLAADLAVNTIYQKFLPEWWQFPLFNNLHARGILNELVQTMQMANDLVTERCPDAGSTLTTALLLGDMLYIGHVGDTRAYFISNTGIEQLTRDHTLLERLFECDSDFSLYDSTEKPYRNVLYRAIGQGETLEVDTVTRRLPVYGYLLLCTDGLWNLVTDSELQQMVLAGGHDVQATSDSLARLANERGGRDNISVILVNIS